ncbi:MAG TPA: CHC2 zinc finger domain-containing protein [Opitutaceae bacterium]|nr:CHC2 zinc finger domain-containing protein [Opitutaceae bacterium]
MPRIPDAELERIKREIDLAALVRAKGIELKPHGSGHLAGKCPFHDDRTPSLIVTPAKNLFHCMGCGAGGSVIDFMMRHDGLSFRHAVEVLRSGQASALVATSALTRKATVPKLAAPVAYDADDPALLAQVIDYYHERLMQTPAALAYLEKRGIRDEEAIRTFKLGFSDRTLGLRLPNKQRVAGAGIRERLEGLGVYRESGHEHLNGCLVFPIITDAGEITEVYGRKIVENQTPGLPKHLYLPGPHRGLWNPAALGSRELILCEAIIDALTFWCTGFRHVTAAYGVEGFTEEMESAIVAAKVERVFIAFDRDEAGERGAAKVAERLLARGIECRRVLFPHGLDANEYARKVQPADKALSVLLTAAAWMGKGRSVPVAASSHVCAPAPSSLEIAAKSLAAQAPANQAVVAMPTMPNEAAKEKAVPQNPPAAPTLVAQGEHWILTLDSREYRVGGLGKTLGSDGLKVALRLKAGDRFHLDVLDLARDGDRRRFIERAAEETGLHEDQLKRDMGRLLLGVEQVQAELARPSEMAVPVVTLSEAERTEALLWLREPDLVGRLRAAFRKAGIIGEENNAFVAYLAGVSRKLERPLAIIIQSASAAGKTTLMDAVLGFFPEEERVKYSAMTGQSLYYLGETNLKHKILAVVEEAGAEKATYALKLLQSEGELTIASTGKDPQTGRMETQEYRVEGPVMIMLTTTAIDLDEELQNRCLTLAVDESPEQTVKIHALQRERRTLAGLVAKAERQELLRVLKNAQRLLAPIEILNPYAPSLTFPSGRTRTRRDHEKYLTLIDAIALLHQHQRPRGRHEVGGRVIDTVEATLDDIALANELAPEVLGRSLDELPPQTRALLGHVRSLVRGKQGEGTFSRRELREACGWSLTQVRVHLERLLELEYLELRHGRLGSPFVYELMMDASLPETVAHIGLIDVETLRHAGSARAQEGSGTLPLAGQNGRVAGGGETPPPPPKTSAPAGEMCVPSPEVTAWRERTSGVPALVAVS